MQTEPCHCIVCGWSYGRGASASKQVAPALPVAWPRQSWSRWTLYQQPARGPPDVASPRSRCTAAWGSSAASMAAICFQASRSLSRMARWVDRRVLHALAPALCLNCCVLLTSPCYSCTQVPDWFLNRQRDFKDGKTGQIVSSTVDSKLREDFERLKKIR